MIRSTRYKYIRNFNALEVLDKNLGDNPRINTFLRHGAQYHRHEPFEELYDVVNDPFEQTNLIAQAEYADVIDNLKRKLFAWMEEQNDVLSADFGTIPIITAPAFQLDQNKPPLRTSVPPEMINILKPEDYTPVEHWLQ
jgi:uncharacterized sulfatase